LKSKKVSVIYLLSFFIFTPKSKMISRTKTEKEKSLPQQTFFFWVLLGKI